MKLFVVILALASVAYAVPVLNQPTDKLIPVENIDSVQNSQNTDVLEVEEYRDNKSLTRNRRFILIDRQIFFAKAGLITLGVIKLKEMLGIPSRFGGAVGGRNGGDY